MVVGVTQGFSKELEIVGVGYRANAKGPGSLELALGYSHPSTSTHPMASPSRSRRRPDHRQGHRQGARRPGGRRHPQVAPSLSPTRARACATRVSACSEGRKGSEVMASRSTRTLRIAVTPGARQVWAPPSGPACVSRSNRHISPADRRPRPVTLAAAFLTEPALARRARRRWANVAGAERVGTLLATGPRKPHHHRRVRPRWLRLHGRVAVLADAARKEGLEF